MLKSELLLLLAEVELNGMVNVELSHLGTFTENPLSSFEVYCQVNEMGYRFHAYGVELNTRLNNAFQLAAKYEPDIRKWFKEGQDRAHEWLDMVGCIDCNLDSGPPCPVHG